jgi:acyl-coenzyme A synthetase/AMP-(fatty) acid ligase
VAVVEHALVTFTTGSTGMPKLMLRQHRLVGRSVGRSVDS